MRYIITVFIPNKGDEIPHSARTYHGEVRSPVPDDGLQLPDLVIHREKFELRSHLLQVIFLQLGALLTLLVSLIAAPAAISEADLPMDGLRLLLFPRHVFHAARL